MCSVLTYESPVMQSITRGNLRDVKRTINQDAVPVDAYHRAASLGHHNICLWLQKRDGLCPRQVVTRAEQQQALPNERYVELCKNVRYDGADDIWALLSPYRDDVSEAQRCEQLAGYLGRWEDARTRCPGLNKVDSQIGGTPLGFAACMGWGSVVRTLLSAGASPLGNFAVGEGRLSSLRGMLFLAAFNPFVPPPVSCLPAIRIGVRAGFMPVVEALLHEVELSEEAWDLLQMDARAKPRINGQLDEVRRATQSGRQDGQKVTAAQLHIKSRFRTYFLSSGKFRCVDPVVRMFCGHAPSFPNA